MSARQSGTERTYTEDVERGLALIESFPSRTQTPNSKALKIQSLPRIKTNLASNKVIAPEEQSARSKLTAPSIYSTYETEPFSTLDFPPPPGITQTPTTPVYGLDGILERTREQVQESRRTYSNTSFEELLRQQTELDKSIAALRLFSTSTESFPNTGVTSNTDVPTPPPIPTYIPLRGGSSFKGRSNSASTASYLGRKPDSASNRSDFSLSIFPEPPVVVSEDFPVSSRLERLVGRARTRREAPNTLTSDMVPIRVRDEETPSLPVSPTLYEGTRRLDSNIGAHYDVTSFIGGLTLPRGSALTTTSVPSELAPSGTEPTITARLEPAEEPTPQTQTVTATAATIHPESGTTQPAAIQPARTQAIRPMILTSSKILAAPVAPSSISQPSNRAPSTERPREMLSPRRDSSVPLRPFLLGTSQLPVILPSSTMVPIGARRKPGLPSNPRRPTISGPSLLPYDGWGDQAPGAFERPRPPPLLFRAV
ncbi:hypothetical protein H0H81_003781 [Sphagnurus paluster]|uniref:Uncharacterized protein n=1 Tax=Sphagnurus paluster TaxID=117069 RepID=A0A9P7GR74_9AGAR|nr:hypothetical protein H0H81_003781 [Sphagnurus paluster]